MDIGILWGLGALAFGGGIYAIWHWEQREKAKTGGATSAAQVAAQVETAVGNAVQSIPRMVSDEVRRLETEGADLLKRAEAAEASFAAEHSASIARTDAVGAAVVKALTELGEMTAEEAAVLAAQLSPDYERFKRDMSQIMDEAMAKLATAVDAAKTAAVDAYKAANPPADTTAVAAEQETADASVVSTFADFITPVA